MKIDNLTNRATSILTILVFLFSQVIVFPTQSIAADPVQQIQDRQAEVSLEVKETDHSDINPEERYLDRSLATFFEPVAITKVAAVRTPASPKPHASPVPNASPSPTSYASPSPRSSSSPSPVQVQSVFSGVLVKVPDDQPSFLMRSVYRLQIDANRSILVDGADEVGQKLLPLYEGQEVELRGEFFELEGMQILKVTHINGEPVEDLLNELPDPTKYPTESEMEAIQGLGSDIVKFDKATVREDGMREYQFSSSPNAAGRFLQIEVTYDPCGGMLKCLAPIRIKTFQIVFDPGPVSSGEIIQLPPHAFLDVSKVEGVIHLPAGAKFTLGFPSDNWLLFDLETQITEQPVREVVIQDLVQTFGLDESGIRSMLERGDMSITVDLENQKVKVHMPGHFNYTPVAAVPFGGVYQPNLLGDEYISSEITYQYETTTSEDKIHLVAAEFRHSGKVFRLSYATPATSPASAVLNNKLYSVTVSEEVETPCLMAPCPVQEKLIKRVRYIYYADSVNPAMAGIQYLGESSVAYRTVTFVERETGLFVDTVADFDSQDNLIAANKFYYTENAVCEAISPCHIEKIERTKPQGESKTQRVLVSVISDFEYILLIGGKFPMVATITRADGVSKEVRFGSAVEGILEEALEFESEYDPERAALEEFIAEWSRLKAAYMDYLLEQLEPIRDMGAAMTETELEVLLEASDLNEAQRERLRRLHFALTYMLHTVDWVFDQSLTLVELPDWYAEFAEAEGFSSVGLYVFGDIDTSGMSLEELRETVNEIRDYTAGEDLESFFAGIAAGVPESAASIIARTNQINAELEALRANERISLLKERAQALLASKTEEVNNYIQTLQERIDVLEGLLSEADEANLQMEELYALLMEERERLVNLSMQYPEVDLSDLGGSNEIILEGLNGSGVQDRDYYTAWTIWRENVARLISRYEEGIAVNQEGLAELEALASQISASNDPSEIKRLLDEMMDKAEDLPVPMVFHPINVSEPDAQIVLNRMNGMLNAMRRNYQIANQRIAQADRQALISYLSGVVSEQAEFIREALEKYKDVQGIEIALSADDLTALIEKLGLSEEEAARLMNLYKYFLVMLGVRADAVPSPSSSSSPSPAAYVSASPQPYASPSPSPASWSINNLVTDGIFLPPNANLNSRTIAALKDFIASEELLGFLLMKRINIPPVQSLSLDVLKDAVEKVKELIGDDPAQFFEEAMEAVDQYVEGAKADLAKINTEFESLEVDPEQQQWETKWTEIEEARVDHMTEVSEAFDVYLREYLDSIDGMIDSVQGILINLQDQDYTGLGLEDLALFLKSYQSAVSSLGVDLNSFLRNESIPNLQEFFEGLREQFLSDMDAALGEVDQFISIFRERDPSPEVLERIESLEKVKKWLLELKPVYVKMLDDSIQMGVVFENQLGNLNGILGRIEEGRQQLLQEFDAIDEQYERAVQNLAMEHCGQTEDPASDATCVFENQYAYSQWRYGISPVRYEEWKTCWKDTWESGVTNSSDIAAVCGEYAKEEAWEAVYDGPAGSTSGSLEPGHYPAATDSFFEVPYAVALRDLEIERDLQKKKAKEVFYALAEVEIMKLKGIRAAVIGQMDDLLSMRVEVMNEYHRIWQEARSLSGGIFNYRNEDGLDFYSRSIREVLGEGTWYYKVFDDDAVSGKVRGALKNSLDAVKRAAEEAGGTFFSELSHVQFGLRDALKKKVEIEYQWAVRDAREEYYGSFKDVMAIAKPIVEDWYNYCHVPTSSDWQQPAECGANMLASSQYGIEPSREAWLNHLVSASRFQMVPVEYQEICDTNLNGEEYCYETVARYEAMDLQSQNEAILDEVRWWHSTGSPDGYEEYKNLYEKWYAGVASSDLFYRQQVAEALLKLGEFDEFEANISEFCSQIGGGYQVLAFTNCADFGYGDDFVGSLQEERDQALALIDEQFSDLGIAVSINPSDAPFIILGPNHYIGHAVLGGEELERRWEELFGAMDEAWDSFEKSKQASDEKFYQMYEGLI
ncbi:MAG: hypothetical protein JW893_06020 [Candidatus Omnitrophica bacterium]|nr:hypothetical protein [Candidatus Omnitrophota bacterium]